MSSPFARALALAALRRHLAQRAPLHQPLAASLTPGIDAFVVEPVSDGQASDSQLLVRVRTQTGASGRVVLVATDLAPDPLAVERQSHQWQATQGQPAPWLADALLAPIAPLLLPAREPLTWSQAAELLGPEAALLAPWQTAVTQYAGAPPQWWLQKRPVQAVLVTLPEPPPNRRSSVGLLLQAPELWSQPDLADWQSSLGFAAGPDGAMRTVPTPQSFARLVQATLGREPAFLPQLVPSSVLVLPVRFWLDQLCSGVIPIGVASTALYRLTAWSRTDRTLRLPQLQLPWHGHFAALGHDMAVHALVTHRLSRDFQRSAAQQIRTVLGNHRVAVGSLTPGPLLAFWEEDLHQYALQCLRDSATLTDVDHNLTNRLPLLQARLHLRIEQAQERRRFGLYFGPKHLPNVDHQAPLVPPRP
jgi:hypothetical protein